MHSSVNDECYLGWFHFNSRWFSGVVVRVITAHVQLTRTFKTGYVKNKNGSASSYACNTQP